MFTWAAHKMTEMINTAASMIENQTFMPFYSVLVLCEYVCVCVFFSSEKQAELGDSSNQLAALQITQGGPSKTRSWLRTQYRYLLCVAIPNTLSHPFSALAGS